MSNRNICMRKIPALRVDNTVPGFGKPDDIVIPVMGPTWTGKSAFINALIGQEGAKFGQDFDSGPTQIQHIWFPPPDKFQTLQDCRLVIVDIPGFDDMDISDEEILRHISVWLAYAHIKSMKTAGVVYLHDISLPCLHPASLRYIEIFRRLCGDQALSGATLVTTKWKLVNEKDGSVREKQLRDDLWKDSISLGSSVERFEGTHDSAWKIMKKMLHRSENNYYFNPLHIQVELIDLGCRISETDASKALRLNPQEIHEIQLRRAQRRGANGLSQEYRLKNTGSKHQVATQNIKPTRRLTIPVGHIHNLPKPNGDIDKYGGRGRWGVNIQKQKHKILELKAGDSIPKFGKPDDIIILVMGSTGTGKSTFINILLREEGVKVGHDFDTGTRKVQHFWFPPPKEFRNLKDRRLVVVDTPGFDDMNICDEEILRLTSIWLAYAYTQGMKTAGVIYLHDISLPRLHPTSLKNIEVFRELCGDEALPGIVLVTTKWGLVNEKDGNAREQQLHDGLWKDIISLGSSEDRFVGTYDSAWKIVKKMLRRFENSYNIDPLQIQVELVDLGRRVSETNAGKTLHLNAKEIYERKLKRARDHGANGSSEEDRHKIAELKHQIEVLKITPAGRILSFLGLA